MGPRAPSTCSTSCAFQRPQSCRTAGVQDHQSDTHFVAGSGARRGAARRGRGRPHPAASYRTTRRGGVLLRAQYLAFPGGVHGAAATRFVARYSAWCGRKAGRRAPVERAWRGSTRLCTAPPRSLYRALGAEHLRHRREASLAVVLRRLLSLDYVVERPGEPWLATEAEKVSALQAAGAPERALPCGWGGRSRRPAPTRWPT